MAWGLGMSLLLLVVCEFLVRAVCPFVHFQGTARELYQYDADGGPGWKPNATGLSFGVPCRIDDLACRKIGEPESAVRSWLILGDSVVFGVGVQAPKTFAGLFQSAHPDVRVLNSGVCGAGPREQLKVVKRLIETVDPAIDRVTLFYCLNDLGEIEFNEEELDMSDRLLHPENRPSVVKTAVQLVRSRSKLYVLLKGLLTDPPTRYFKWELEKYREWEAGDPGDVGSLVEIGRLAEENQVEFQVYILPYVAQYASEAKDAWLPQEKVADYLRDHHIQVVDARPWFEGEQMKDCFLFADGCHFSELGHQRVFEQLESFPPAPDSN